MLPWPKALPPADSCLTLTLAEIETLLHAAWVVDPAAGLRADDRRKAAQLAALIPEILRLRGGRGRGPGTLMDAAAGRGPVGLAAALALRADARAWTVQCLERDAARVAVIDDAAGRLALSVRGVCGAVADPVLWPQKPDIVVALHACGGATDAILDQAARVEARSMLLVPCCYGAAQVHDDGPYAPPRAQALASARAEAMGLPELALLRGRFARAIIDAERTLRLEAAGYQTEVVELFSAGISPFNLLWRARRVGEPVRMARAAERSRRLWG